VIAKIFPGLYPGPPFSRGGEGREGDGKVRREGKGKAQGKGREMGRE
jgi:hypothetical protein